MLRAGFRRVLVFLAVVLGGTAAASAALGALAGANISRSVATGYYLIGSAVLVGSFVLGVRGPLRSEAVEHGEAAPLRYRGSRRRRRTTAEERQEGRRISLALFVLGVALVLLAAVIDPSRSAL